MVGNHFDAFISYRHEGGFFAAYTLWNELLAKGVLAFMDHAHLRQSGNFDDRLYEAIRNSRCLIIVLSPGALDRCKEEDDWVRKEIMAAVDAEKPIIPFLCSGFSWAKVEDPGLLPQGVYEIKRKKGVVETDEYLAAMIDDLITLIGIESERKKEEHLSSLVQYFLDALVSSQTVTGIDIALHGGDAWFRDYSKFDMLKRFSKEGIPVRVLVNTPDAAEIVAKHTRNGAMIRSLYSFEDCIASWKTYIAQGNDNVELRISDIPLLRQYYSVHMSDSALDTVNVRYYTYGNYKMDENYRNIFTARSEYFKLYRDEFLYLWERAEKAE